MMLYVVTFFETLIFTCVMWTYPKSALTPISCVQTVALVAYSVQTHKPWECQNLMQVSFKWLIEPHEIGVWHLQRAKTILYSWERKSKKLDPPITPISLAGSICSWGSRNKPSETTSHAVDPSSKSKVCSILFFKKKTPLPSFPPISWWLHRVAGCDSGQSQILLSPATEPGPQFHHVMKSCLVVYLLKNMTSSVGIMNLPIYHQFLMETNLPIPICQGLC